MAAIKSILRVLFALALIAALVCYIIEFVEGNQGYIVVFVFILLFIILGAAGVWTENLVVLAIFVIGMLVLVIVDAIYVGWIGGIVTGSLAVGFGAFYTIALMMGK